MNDVLHANIFFFITSVAVVAVTLMLLVVLWYVIEILREVRKVAKKISKASDGLERDIEYIRTEVKSNLGKVAGLITSAGAFFLGTMARPKKRSAPKKKPFDETETEESV